MPFPCTSLWCHREARPLASASILRLSDNRSLNIARETFEKSLGEAWTSGLIGATAGGRNR